MTLGPLMVDVAGTTLTGADRELLAHPLRRLIVSKPDVVAEAIADCALHGKAERYAPRYYWLAAAARILAPRLVAKAVAGGAFTTATNPDLRN